MRNMTSARTGFTTVEVLVVVGFAFLIGVLAVPVVRAAAKATAKATAAVTQQAEKPKTETETAQTADADKTEEPVAAANG